MDDAPIDLRKLAEEAAATVYMPRAKKCWPWSHEWTMWERCILPPFRTIWGSGRRCVRCGKYSYKSYYHEGDPSKQPPECKPRFTPSAHDPHLGTWSKCPNLREAGGDMSGERYGCEVCGKSYFLDYDDMR